MGQYKLKLRETLFITYYLLLNQMVKVAIIGCGIVGAAIAYELSQIPGLDITIIEQKTPASGSTGAALGVSMGVISHKTKNRGWRLREASLKRYQTLLPELESLTGITIPVNCQGIVKLLFPGDIAWINGNNSNKLAIIKDGN